MSKSGSVISSQRVCNVENILRKIINLTEIVVRKDLKLESSSFEVYPLIELLSVLIDHYGFNYTDVVGVGISHDDYVKLIFENCYITKGNYRTITSRMLSRPLLLELCSVNFILVTYFHDYLKPYKNKLRDSVNYIIDKWVSETGKFNERDLKEDILYAPRKIGHYSYLLNYMATMMFVSMKNYFSEDKKMLTRINSVISEMVSITKQDFQDALEIISNLDYSNLSYTDLERLIYRFTYNYWILKLCDEEYLSGLFKDTINRIFVLFLKWLNYYAQDYERIIQEMSTIRANRTNMDVIQVERLLRELITKRIKFKLRTFGSELDIFISVVPHVLRFYVNLVKEFGDFVNIEEHIRNIDLIVSIFSRYISVVYDNVDNIIENFEFVKAYYSVFYITLLNYKDLLNSVCISIDDLVQKSGDNIDFQGIIDLLNTYSASEAYIVSSNIYIDQSIVNIFSSVYTFILPDVFPYSIIIFPERKVAIITSLPLANASAAIIGRYYIAKEVEFENILSQINSYISKRYQCWCNLLNLSDNFSNKDASNNDRETLKLIVDVLSILVDDVTKGEIVKDLICEYGVDALKAVYNYYKLDPKYHELNVARAMGFSSNDKLDVENLLAEKRLYSRMYNWKELLNRITSTNISRPDRIYNYIFDVESSELFFKYLSSLSEKDLKTALSKFGIHELYIHDRVYNKYKELIELIDNSPADVGKIKRLSDIKVSNYEDVDNIRGDIYSIKSKLGLEGLIDEDIDVLSYVLCLNRRKNKRIHYGLVTNTYEVARCAKEFNELWDVTFALLNIISTKDVVKDTYRSFGRFLRVPLKYLMGIFD